MRALGASRKSSVRKAWHSFRPSGCQQARRHHPCIAARATSKDAAVSRDEGLTQLQALLTTDKIQDSDMHTQAVSVMDDLKAAGAVRGFGGGRQIPKRLYTLDELRLNKIDAEALLSPKDDTLDTVQTVAQVAYLAGVVALGTAAHLDVGQVGGILLATIFAFGLDQVQNGGGGAALVLDTLGRYVQPSYRQRVAYHEAGHFLVAYLVGLLPIAYTLSSLDAYRRYGALNIQAGCLFADGDFAGEVAAGRLKASSLERYTCVALSGVCSEYLQFGKAEGGKADVQQLDGMLRALQFSQKKADGEVRWAVLNTISLLRRHRAVHEKLAAAMDAGKPVTACLAVVEDELAKSDDI